MYPPSEYTRGRFIFWTVIIPVEGSTPAVGILTVTVLVFVILPPRPSDINYIYCITSCRARESAIVLDLKQNQ